MAGLLEAIGYIPECAGFFVIRTQQSAQELQRFGPMNRLAETHQTLYLSGLYSIQRTVGTFTVH